MSFDDIAVALFAGGGDAMTLPVKIYTSVEFNFDADIMAVSTLVTAGSPALMLVLDRLIGIDSFPMRAGADLPHPNRRLNSTKFAPVTFISVVTAADLAAVTLARAAGGGAAEVRHHIARRQLAAGRFT